MPAFQPYWGTLAVRNDRGDRGNVGIIRSPVRASILPDQLRHWPAFHVAVAKRVSGLSEGQFKLLRWSVLSAGVIPGQEPRPIRLPLITLARLIFRRNTWLTMQSYAANSWWAPARSPRR